MSDRVTELLLVAADVAEEEGHDQEAALLRLLSTRPRTMWTAEMVAARAGLKPIFPQPGRRSGRTLRTACEAAAHALNTVGVVVIDSLPRGMIGVEASRVRQLVAACGGDPSNVMDIRQARNRTSPEAVTACYVDHMEGWTTWRFR